MCRTCTLRCAAPRRERSPSSWHARAPRPCSPYYVRSPFRREPRLSGLAALLPGGTRRSAIRSNPTAASPVPSEEDARGASHVAVGSLVRPVALHDAARHLARAMPCSPAWGRADSGRTRPCQRTAQGRCRPAAGRSVHPLAPAHQQQRRRSIPAD